MKIKQFILLAFLALTISSLLSCGGDSGPTLYEFAVTKVESAAPDVYLGHPANVNVTITSNDEAENVPVEILLAKHTETLDAEVSFYTAGTYIIPTVKRGENTYPVKVTVPAHQIAAGDYKIAARVDPALSMSREREECVPGGDAEANRKKACFKDDTISSVNVSVSYIKKPDLMIEDITLTTDVATIVTTDTVPDFITGTLKVKSVAVETLNVPVRYTLTIKGVEYPLMIWDSEIEGYANDYWIGQFRANESKSIPFMLDIDAATAGNLDVGQNPVTLKATIDPDKQVTEADIPGLSGGTANNTISKTMTIVKDTAVKALKFAEAGGRATRAGGFEFSKSYSQMLGSGMFGARPFFSTLASLNENGAAGHAEGGVEVSIFYGTFNFVYLGASAAALPQQLSSSFIDLRLEFVGITLYSFHRDGEYSWDKDWTIYKSKGYTATFWVSFIPLNVSAGAQGSIGFSVGFSVGDSLEATASVFANAGAYASASVGISGLIEGGVKGASIVNFETKAIINAGMALQYNPNLQISGWLQERLTCTIAGPSGSLGLFAKFGYPLFCRWWYIYYPCGWATQEYWMPIVSFSTWSKELELLNLTQNMPWINTGL